MSDYTPPTTEEIQRVAEYWRRAEILACEHKTGFTFSSAEPICSDCGQVIRFLTDTQIEQIKARKPFNDVRDRLLSQMNRGGIRFEADGRWYEVRFHAHGYDGTDPDSECICIEVKNVELLLQATDA